MIITTENNIPKSDPSDERKIASYPRPSNTNLCPGSTLSAVSLDGTPNRIEGIKSINEWIIPITKRKIINSCSETYSNTKKECTNARVATKLIWIPGTNPVMIPANIPKRIGSRISFIKQL